MVSRSWLAIAGTVRSDLVSNALESRAREKRSEANLDRQPPVRRQAASDNRHAIWSFGLNFACNDSLNEVLATDYRSRRYGCVLRGG